MQPFTEATPSELNRLLKILDELELIRPGQADSIMNLDWFLDWADGKNYPVVNEQSTITTIEYWERLVEGHKND